MGGREKREKEDMEGRRGRRRICQGEDAVSVVSSSVEWTYVFLEYEFSGNDGSVVALACALCAFQHFDLDFSSW